jgi:hypothetical protein
MPIDPHPVAAAAAVAANALAETTINPATGGVNMHVVGSAFVTGPVAPGVSQSVVQALSPDFATGGNTSIGVSGNMSPLCSAWATSQTYVAGRVIFAPKSFKPSDGGTATGAFLICSTAGAGATSGTGPALAVGALAVADGAAAKWDWLTDSFRNGVMLTNTDGIINGAANPLYYASRSNAAAALCDAIVPGGKVVLPRSDPTAIFAFSLGGFSWVGFL